MLQYREPRRVYDTEDHRVRREVTMCHCHVPLGLRSPAFHPLTFGRMSKLVSFDLSLLFSSLELPLSTPNSPEVSGLTPPAAALPAALLPADPPARSTECRHSASRISPAGGADPNWRVSLWLAPSPAPAKRRSLPADAAGRGVMCGSEHGRDRLAQ